MTPAKGGYSEMPWNLIGFGSITSSLSQMMANKRLPHALLFTGPAGSGKSSLAKALAQAVNCEGRSAAYEPCGLCRSCLKIESGIHPDVKSIAPSGRSRHIKMDDVQSLRQEMSFRPYEGRSKFFIIKEADRLGNESGNALLKTLEEPPPDSILILTSASESELLPTILSRCLRLRVPPLPYELLLDALGREKGVNDERAELVAALSNGALGVALNLDPDEIWEYWRHFDSVLGTSTPAKRLEGAWQWVAAAAGDETKYNLIINIMRLWWRQATLAHANINNIEGPPMSEAQKQWGSKLTAESLKKIHAALSKLEDSLSRFIKAELAFENYWLSILSS